MSAALAAASDLGVRPTCAALALAPATFYRYRNGPTESLALERRGGNLRAWRYLSITADTNQANIGA